MANRAGSVGSAFQVSFLRRLVLRISAAILRAHRNGTFDGNNLIRGFNLRAQLHHGAHRAILLFREMDRVLQCLLGNVHARSRCGESAPE